MRFSSNKGLVVLHLFLLGLAITVILALTMEKGEREEQAYQAIASKTASEKASKEYQAEQKRSGIYREIFIQHKGQRLQIRMTAKEGVLTMFHDGKVGGFVEHLTDFECIMQEELYTENGRPMQRLRMIKSNEAYYDFKANTLKTDKMSFARFTAPGYDLPQVVEHLTPILTGKAQSAEITLDEKGPKFHAYHLQVTIPQARGL